MSLPVVSKETIAKLGAFISEQLKSGRGFDLDKMCKEQPMLASLVIQLKDSFPDPGSFLSGVSLVYMSLLEEATPGGITNVTSDLQQESKPNEQGQNDCNRRHTRLFNSFPSVDPGSPSNN